MVFHDISLFIFGYDEESGCTYLPPILREMEAMLSLIFEYGEIRDEAPPGKCLRRSRSVMGTFFPQRGVNSIMLSRLGPRICDEFGSSIFDEDYFLFFDTS